MLCACRLRLRNAARPGSGGGVTVAGTGEVITEVGSFPNTRQGMQRYIVRANSVGIFVSSESFGDAALERRLRSGMALLLNQGSMLEIK